MEEWRTVPEYKGLYEASNLGRIRSLDRVVMQYDPRVNGYYKSKRKGKILKPCDSGKLGDRHMSVHLDKDGVKKHNQVGCFVLLAFGKTKPEGEYIECSHLDGNPENNKLGNLVWETRKQNFARKEEHGTSSKGTRNPMAKLNDEDVKEIKQLLVNREHSQVTIAEHFGVSRRAISMINTNSTWAHIKWPKGKI